jgi:hypothetical protein
MAAPLPGRLSASTESRLRLALKRSSDTLIVKIYVMSAMRFVVPIGDVLSATDESTTR